MSSLSRLITGWVAESNLNEADAKKRTALVKFFTKVADVRFSLSMCCGPVAGMTDGLSR